MKTNLILAVFAASSYAFLFAACKSKEEKARDAAIESHADTVEAQGKEAKKNADAAAESAKEAGKDAQKQLDKEADKIREQK